MVEWYRDDYTVFNRPIGTTFYRDARSIEAFKLNYYRIYMKLKAGTIKRIHVDKHVIAANLKHGRNDPPITIQTSKGSHKCFGVDIRGPSRFMYRPTKPLSCGARLFVETKAEIVSNDSGIIIKIIGKVDVALAA